MSIRVVGMVLLLMWSAAFGQQGQTVEDYIRDGNVSLSRGDAQFALILFQEALKLEEVNVEAMLGKGKALLALDSLTFAIEEFQRVLSQEPNNVAAHVQLALAYQKQYENDRTQFPTRLSDALGALEKAEQIDANSAEIMNGKGVVFFLMGDFANARVALERAVSLATSGQSLNDRDIATMHINLGKTYRDLGELQLALQSFRRAVMLVPNSASAHNNVGTIYTRLGNCDQAVYELTQATKLNPNAVDIVANLAISLFDCGNVQESIPYFEQALAIPEALNFPGLYTYAARGYLQQGRFDDAVKRAQQGALLPPVTADAFFYLGQAYEARNSTGDQARAKEAYQKALEINPDYQPARDALSRLP